MYSDYGRYLHLKKNSDEKSCDRTCIHQFNTLPVCAANLNYHLIKKPIILKYDVKKLTFSRHFCISSIKWLVFTKEVSIRDF